MTTVLPQLARRKGAWRWPNFSPAEIACRGPGKLLVNEPALERLQALRDRLGKPLVVRSAYRSPSTTGLSAGPSWRHSYTGGRSVALAQ